MPYVNYVTDTVPQRYMTDDQRFAAKRPDVLTYETEPLAEDITIAGPVRPKLRISSTGTDADFVVKLIDVYPEDFPNPPSEGLGKRILGPPPILLGGYEQLVRGEPMRAKFRDSWEKPTPLPIGKVVEVNSEMPDINHTFRAGHRIMVQVQSSWFPLVDRNPQDVRRHPAHEAERLQKGDGEASIGRAARRVVSRCWCCRRAERAFAREEGRALQVARYSLSATLFLS